MWLEGLLALLKQNTETIIRYLGFTGVSSSCDMRIAKTHPMFVIMIGALLKLGEILLQRYILMLSGRQGLSRKQLPATPCHALPCYGLLCRFLLHDIKKTPTLQVMLASWTSQTTALPGMAAHCIMQAEDLAFCLYQSSLLLCICTTNFVADVGSKEAEADGLAARSGAPFVRCSCMCPYA